jgi:hypothetical protein
MNKTLLGIAAALVLGGIGLGGWLLSGSDEPQVATLNCDTIRADLDAVIAKLAPDRRATISGLECAQSRLSLAELRLLPADVSLDASTITLTGLVLTGLDVDNLKAFLAPAAPGTPAPDRLSLAGEITVAKVRFEGADSSIAFDDAHVAGIAGRPLAQEGTLRDRLGALAFDSASARAVQLDPPGANQPTVSYHAVAVSAFDGARIGRIDLQGWASAAPDGSVRMGCDQASYSGMSASSLAIMTGYAPDMPVSTPEQIQADPQAALGEMARMLEAMGKDVSVDQAGADNCVVSGETPGAAFDGKIAKWSITKQVGISFAETAYEGADFTIRAGDEKIFVTLGRFAMSGVDIGAFFKPWADGTGMAPDFSGFRVEGYELADLAVAREGRPPVKLGSFVVKGSDYVDNIASAGSMRLSGFVFPIAIIDSEEARRPLADLGYDEIKLDADIAYTYDHKTKSLEMKQFEVAQADGGKFSLTFKFADYDIKALYEAMGAMRPPLSLAGAKLEALTASYEDHSLFGRLIKVMAREQEISPEDLVAQAQEDLANASLSAPGPLTKAAVTEVTRFLADPKRIVLSLAPTRTATFAEIGGRIEDMEGLARLLGLSVKAD